MIKTFLPLMLFGSLLLDCSSALLAQKAVDDSQATKKESKKSLDEELLNNLLGNKSDAEKQNEDPLENAIQAMRKVEKQIANREAGDEKRTLQKQIISDLEKLIEKAKQPKPSSNQPDQQHQPKNQQEQGNPEQQKPQKAQHPDQKQNSNQNKQAQESTERNNQAENKEVELAKRRKLVKAIWGHLPPAFREKLLNTSSEKTLPKYQDLVRLYYEALAESNRTKSDSR